jgi:KaiC/GvpD/RAD55 family RecA-like ATPase
LEDYVAGAEPADELAEVRLAHPGYFDALPSPVPDKRSVILISGASGAGKSHWALHFCSNYKKLFPERKVLLVSSFGSRP